MSVIPSVSARDMVTVLLKVGFKIIRQKGSHIRFHNPMTNRSATVAMHAGDLTKKVVKQILTQAGMSNKDLIELLRK